MRDNKALVILINIIAGVHWALTCETTTAIQSSAMAGWILMCLCYSVIKEAKYIDVIIAYAAQIQL